MKYLLSVLLLLFAVAVIAGCASDSKSVSANAPAGCEACQIGKDGGTARCDACGVGYVDGKKTKCMGCYAAKTGGPACAACK